MLHPVFEATDTILFSTDERTSSGPHIRDSVDIKRVMILVVISLLPCYIFGAINIGYQKSITFPVTLDPDWDLEYEGDGPVRVFDPNGFTKAEVEPQGVVPTIRKGDNDVMFFCDQGQDQGQTAKIMFITRGKPLR